MSSRKPLQSPSRKVAGALKFEGELEVRSLFDELGVHYTARTLFTEDCRVFERTKRSDYAEYGKTSKISDETFEHYSDLIRAGHKAPMHIKWTSDGVGYGVFASEDLPAGTFIAEYAGVVTPRDQVKNRTWSWSYPIRGRFIDGLPSRASLDGRLYGNELRFVNHSDHRNISAIFVHDGTTWVNCYYARKAIAKGEELLVNYGKRYWKTRTKIDL